MVTFESQLKAKCFDAYVTLVATDDEIASYNDMQRAHARGWDVQLSSVLLACIDRKSARGKVLLQILAERERKLRRAVHGGGHLRPAQRPRSRRRTPPPHRPARLPR